MKVHRDTFSHIPLNKPLRRTPDALNINKMDGVWFYHNMLEKCLTLYWMSEMIPAKMQLSTVTLWRKVRHHPQAQINSLPKNMSAEGGRFSFPH